MRTSPKLHAPLSRRRKVPKASSEDDAEKKIHAADVSIYSNISLTILKIVSGLLSGSLSIMSEAVHSGMDILTSVMVKFSVKNSMQPPDEKHDFGHGKIESISGLVEVILIFIIAVYIIYESAQRLFGPAIEIEYMGVGIAVMAVSTIVNTIVSREIMKTARETDSTALEMNAWHRYMDVIMSFGVFVGLMIISVTGWALLDPVIAIIVALFIIRMLSMVAKKSVSNLIDEKLPENEMEAIEKVLKDDSKRYIEFHELRTRKSSSDRFIDLHLVISKNAPIRCAHDLCDRLEAKIKARLPNSNVLIHVEPCDGKCSTCEKKGVCKDAHKEKYRKKKEAPHTVHRNNENAPSRKRKLV